MAASSWLRVGQPGIAFAMPTLTWSGVVYPWLLPGLALTWLGQEPAWQSWALPSWLTCLGRTLVHFCGPGHDFGLPLLC